MTKKIALNCYSKIGETMKKYYVLILFLLLPSFAHAKTITGMGDSITTGYGVSEKESYFALLCSHLTKEEPYSCHNLAQNGLTSEGLLKQLEDESVLQNVRKSDYIVFSIGGNDFLQELIANLFLYLGNTSNFTSFDQVKNKLLANLEAICQTLKKENPNVKLLILPIYNPYYELLKRNEALTTKFKETQTEYTKHARRYGIVPDKIANSIENQQYLNASVNNLDPHPTALGHQMIAESLVETFEVPITKKQSKSYYLIIPLILILSFVIFWVKKSRKTHRIST